MDLFDRAHLIIKLSNNEILECTDTNEVIKGTLEKICDSDRWIQLNNNFINVNQIVRIECTNGLDKFLKDSGVQRVELKIGELYKCRQDGCEYYASIENGDCVIHRNIKVGEVSC